LIWSLRDDEILGPVFANMPADHPHHVALWLSEVFGGPSEYSERHGGYAHMVAKHVGLALTERQRARWVQLIGLAADDAGLPSDPGFRSAFIAYIEWGTRIALANSQPEADSPPRSPDARLGMGRSTALSALTNAHCRSASSGARHQVRSSRPSVRC
jgi:hemoglobin